MGVVGTARGRHALGAAGALLALSLVGCRTPCLADEKASRAQLAREQKAVFRGQGICLELAAPKLALLDDRITLTATRENVLARRADLPADQVTRLAPLDERLRGYREHFKQVRADPFEPTLYLDLDPALEPAKAASLLTTAGYAGFARSRLHTGDLDLTLRSWAPEADAAAVALCVESPSRGGPEGNAGFDLRFEGRTTPPRHAASLESLDAEITTACAAETPCAGVVGIGLDARATVLDVARVTKAVLASRPFTDQRPAVVLASTAPMSGTWPSRGANDAARHRPCSRAGLAR